MLTTLRIRDFVIVDTLTLHFEAGFSVLSGETGAGKSILIDALSLALGARADGHVVREGAARTDISAEFAIDADLEAWLSERSLEGDPGQLHVRRVIDAEGRSRASINHHPVTLAILRTLGGLLVDIHGQHASQALLRSDGQRTLLDQVARLSGQVAAVSTRFQAWRAAQDALSAAQQGLAESARERERLQWQIDELMQVAPVPDEWEALNAEQKRLAHAATLIEGARAMADGLNDAEHAISPRLHTLQQRLRGLLTLDASLQPVAELLESAAIATHEAAATLHDYAERIELDADRLAAVEQRISALFNAGRKLRVPPEQLPETLAAWQQAQAALPQAHDLPRLAERAAHAEADYMNAAQGLREARCKAAATLAQEASVSIAALGMPGARLEIAIEAAEPASHGIDRIEFRIAGHAGVAARPLAKVASGGELSRVSLAISALAAQANPVATLIFDEADTGVGGAVAEVIGALMRKLGHTRQVLCVTHWAQVAAQAHQHYRVAKHQSGGQTLSHITHLDASQRIEEIARMLGGVAITDTTRQHAREMLGQAAMTPLSRTCTRDTGGPKT